MDLIDPSTSAPRALSLSTTIALMLWRWWKGVDRQLIFTIFVLISISILLVATASSSVAIRVGLPSNYFILHHLFNTVLSVVVMLSFSLIDLVLIRRYIIWVFIANILLLILVKLYGIETKGARRWINLYGFSLQPSEFIKPVFAVLSARILTFNSFHNSSRYKAFAINIFCYTIVATLLILQPDFGMLITVTLIWGAQLFIAGLPLLWLAVALFVGCIGLFVSYNVLPHVAARLDSFFDTNQYENYQVSKSLAAFEKGHFFGSGPGEGVIKQVLPDSHTDFIFAVAGEELGLFVCLLINGLFAFIVVRSLIIVKNERDAFISIASVGLIAQIGVQSTINMGVSLNLLPTKGMTLPFVSYGGSSSLAIAIAIGVLLAISKKGVVRHTWESHASL